MQLSSTRLSPRRRRTRPPALIIALGVVAALVGGWFLVANPGAQTLRAAGSTAVVAPIAPLRLVSEMGAERGVPDSAAAAANNLSFTDAEIESAVAAKLKEMKLSAETVEISVSDREAHLSGRVADPLLRDAIEITVRSVPGVRTVTNQLEVLNAAKKGAP